MRDGQRPLTMARRGLVHLPDKRLHAIRCPASLADRRDLQGGEACPNAIKGPLADGGDAMLPTRLLVEPIDRGGTFRVRCRIVALQIRVEHLPGRLWNTRGPIPTCRHAI